MKPTNLLIVAIALTTAGASAAEKRIRRADLPAAVQRTADTQSKGATVVGYAMETEGGKVEYEVRLIVDGHTKDVTIDSNGNVLQVEEQAAINALPTKVIFGLRRRAGQGKITKVESLTRHSEIVGYEAQVESGGKHFEIQVGLDGEEFDNKE